MPYTLTIEHGGVDCDSWTDAGRYVSLRRRGRRRPVRNRIWGRRARPALDVGVLSARQLEDLVEAGLGKTPADLFRILDVGEKDGEVDGDVDREGKGGGNDLVEVIAVLAG